MSEQIVVSEEILYLRRLYENIRTKCIAEYFEHAMEKDAFIYENIINDCLNLFETVVSKYGTVSSESENFGEKINQQRCWGRGNGDLDVKTPNMADGVKKWSEKEINQACETAYYYHKKFDGHKFTKYDFFDVEQKQPVYIDFGKSVTLLEWSENENPYRKLQEASSYCLQEQQPDVSILAKLYSEILNLLDNKAPVVKIVRLLGKFQTAGNI